MSFFKAGRHSSTETSEECPRCGTIGISGQRCPNPRCGYKLGPNVAQVFLDPFLDVGRAAKRSVGSAGSASGSGTSSGARTGCGTIVVVLLMIAVGIALLKAILPFLIGGVVLLVAGLVFYAVGKRIGFGKAFLIFAGLGVAGFTFLFIRARVKAAAYHEEDERRKEERRQEEAKDEADKATLLAQKRSVFQTGYSKLVPPEANALPATLAGAWKVRERGGGSPITATITASMLSGLDPNLTDVRFHVTDQNLAFVGKGTRYGSAMTCAGVFEAVGVADRFLLGMVCQNVENGDLIAAAYTGSNANLPKEIQKGTGIEDDSTLLPKDLRGVWLADDDCTKRKADSKRRTIITGSMVLGNGGNEDDGVLQIRVTSSTGTIVFDGLKGPRYSTKSCKGQIESSGAGSYVMNLKCDGGYDHGPTQLCKKATNWQDF
jgi:hypothetical protein